MTFTEITASCDQIRDRFRFNWLDPDQPDWDWPAKRTGSSSVFRKRLEQAAEQPVVVFGSGPHVQQFFSEAG